MSTPPSHPARFPTARLLPRARLGAPLAAALLAAACASSGGSPADDVPPGAIGGVSPSPGQVVETVISTHPARAGTFLTDGTGRTVYLWARDGRDRSACSGACAAAWPPVQAKGKLVATGGAHAGDLVTIARPAASGQRAGDPRRARAVLLPR